MHKTIHTPQKTRLIRNGFTLLELLVVMVIIGLLAAYVGPRYFAQIGKSEQGAARAQIEALAKALDTYRLDTGHYPGNDVGLSALTVKPGNETKWQGPYLQKEVPLDTWGRAYLYTLQDASGDFSLKSLGKDGQPGGDGDNADISYR
ncbi:type II secretion system protein GspG [Rhodoferax lacus]|uniref:Type II secretion system core protein G n=2 Tax=Rhodoferax lacus TaxID=2184758 RepID=A0A3E1RHT9_9BURK|nr:type II secretion system major pseudopilin GspG [Rhodoferax lacus]RFO98965.1 type II secretion system protein GspG [Rhodoferax lacus]